MLFNELWLSLGSAVGVEKNYSHKGRCLKIHSPTTAKRTCKTLTLRFKTLLEKKQEHLS